LGGLDIKARVQNRSLLLGSDTGPDHASHDGATVMVRISAGVLLAVCVVFLFFVFVVVFMCFFVLLL
jgi:hypothetical protein